MPLMFTSWIVCPFDEVVIDPDGVKLEQDTLGPTYALSPTGAAGSGYPHAIGELKQFSV
jgi:hypothetical protein